MIDFHVEIKPSLDILYGSASHCKYTGKGKNNITIIAVNKKALGQLYQQTQYYEGVNYLPIDAKVSSDHSGTLKKSQTNLKYYHIPKITQSTITRSLENKYSGIKDLMKPLRANN